MQDKSLVRLPVKYHRGWHLDERLARRSHIKQLFERGRTMRCYPLQLHYLVAPVEIPCHCVLFVVPKRRVKRATARNKIKRQLRAAYRQHKHLLYAQKKTTYLFLSYVYIGHAQAVKFDQLSNSISKTVKHLCDYV